MFRASHLLALALSALVALGLAAPAGADGLSVQLSLETSDLSIQDASTDVPLRFTLTNEGGGTERLAKWYTPLTGDLYGPIFSVTRDGQAVAYVGKLYKLRAVPLAEDYIVVKAGRSVTRVIDLTEFYDMSAAGNYEVQYRADALSEAGARLQAAGTLTSNTLLFYSAGGSAPALPVSDDVSTQALAPAFRSCSSSRQSTVRTALPNSERYARESLQFLQNLPTSQRPSNGRYKTWFGAYTSSRYSTVQSHFSRIAGALTGRTITFHCDCNESAYAYVFPGDPYNIHLCRAFWTAPNLGRDSKAGTIIHEMSHFDVNGGTDDHVYGESGCKNLARTSPGRAVNNADSHEYFAEQ